MPPSFCQVFLMMLQFKPKPKLAMSLFDHWPLTQTWRHGYMAAPLALARHLAKYPTNVIQ